MQQLSQVKLSATFVFLPDQVSHARTKSSADIRTSDEEGLQNPEDGFHDGHPRHHRDHVRHHLHQAQPGGRQDAHLSSKADRQQHEGELRILRSLLT